MLTRPCYIFREGGRKQELLISINDVGNSVNLLRVSISIQICKGESELFWDYGVDKVDFSSLCFVISTVVGRVGIIGMVGRQVLVVA